MTFDIHIFSLLRRRKRKPENSSNQETKRTLCIELAGLVIRIIYQNKYFPEFCNGFLVPDTRDPDIIVEAKEEDIQREMEKCRGMIFGRGNAETVAVYEQISNVLPEHDAFVMHSSVVAVNGKAYCFAAESGTGKSTHTKYWMDVLGEKVTVINGDKPIYRFLDGELIAYGTPWNGKEKWGENTCAPLKGLCLLERSEINGIEQIDPFDALPELMKHFNLANAGKVDTPKLIELIDRMIQTVPVYRLKCRNDQSAAETAIRSLIHDINDPCKKIS